MEQFVALYDGDAQSAVDTVNALTAGGAASAGAMPLMTPLLLDDVRCAPARSECADARRINLPVKVFITSDID